MTEKFSNNAVNRWSQISIATRENPPETGSSGAYRRKAFILNNVRLLIALLAAMHFPEKRCI